MFAINVNMYAGDGVASSSAEEKSGGPPQSLGAASSRLFAMFKETLVGGKVAGANL